MEKEFLKTPEELSAKARQILEDEWKPGQWPLSRQLQMSLMQIVTDLAYLTKLDWVREGINDPIEHLSVQKEEEKEDEGVKLNHFYCPTCGERAVLNCRCPRVDCKCPNGHEWHSCTIHKVKVLGKSDHSTDTFTCTCGKENGGVK